MRPAYPYVTDAHQSNIDRLDPHALAMALQLADVVAEDLLANWNSRHGEYISHWLRSEVQKALESQP